MPRDVVGQCRRTWRRIGVSREDAAEMAAELAADLDAARRDGRDPQSFVGGDPTGFARAWASERGAVPLRYRTGRLMLAVLLGVLPGPFAGMFAVFGLASADLAQVVGRDPEGIHSPNWLVALLFAVSAVATWAGALAAASAVLRFHADAARGATVRVLAVLLPLIALGAAASTALVARHWNYPYGLGVVLTEIAVPFAAVVAAAGAARTAIVRRSRPAPGPAESTRRALLL
ncbi:MULTISPECIES: hypothetical protein [Actinomadura]|uniref:Uncharacterized protein n=1 Tax=Actinomadura litoris TaxID=2678616 RepID=A0A7K1KXL1_9ACTN|nr:MULTISPECIES: hypothetical protein [Actinomadura]MBT2209248.1 hypothetical protein [Actinomadura sp. NEAU-AAG7]MUN36942.1 hypothetical protein [Actinomadura litoris]